MAKKESKTAKKSKKRPSFKKQLLTQLSFVGLMVGILFVALSLTPSLLPRSWFLQGAASGLSLVAGYGIGVFIIWSWRAMLLPEIPKKHLANVQYAVLALAMLPLLYTLYWTGTWQNEIRNNFGLEANGSTHPIRILLLACVLAVLILLIVRVVRYLARKFIDFVYRYVPHRVGTVVGLVFFAWLLISLVSGVLPQAALDFANSTFSVTDGATKEGSVQPTSSLRSTGPGSPVQWNELGRQGREFIGSGPTAQDIARFNPDAKEPIRVYVGLKGGDSHEDRAQIVLDELIRTNAFDREILLVATATGTGWLDPRATETFEYVNGGDTAIASMQYSYLPSWIGILADQQTAQDAGIALFNAVHRYWQDLPEDDRPELYLYGLSLGAYGSQASISRVEVLNDPINGALWVGPPFVSEFWNRTTDDRDEGSPAWQPIYQQGEVVRFTGNDDGLSKPTGQWQDNKIIYLQYPTDAVVFFSFESLLTEPEWLQGERGPGVSQHMQYYPFVTFWQLAIDMAGAGGVPAGFGHQYSKDSYINTWSALTEPDGWSEERSQELSQLLNS